MQSGKTLTLHFKSLLTWNPLVESDAETVAPESSDLSDHNWEITYKLSFITRRSNITVVGEGGDDSEEEDEVSEEIAALEQQDR